MISIIDVTLRTSLYGGEKTGSALPPHAIVLTVIPVIAMVVISCISLARVLYRHVADCQQNYVAPGKHENDENRPPSISQGVVLDIEDAKAERIRQLHLTLGALIDERDELQDTLSNSAGPELALQLEQAHAELQVLRQYAESHTSGRTSLAEMDLHALQ